MRIILKYLQSDQTQRTNRSITQVCYFNKKISFSLSAFTNTLSFIAHEKNIATHQGKVKLSPQGCVRNIYLPYRD